MRSVFNEFHRFWHKTSTPWKENIQSRQSSNSWLRVVTNYRSPRTTAHYRINHCQFFHQCIQLQGAFALNQFANCWRHIIHPSRQVMFLFPPLCFSSSYSCRWIVIIDSSSTTPPLWASSSSAAAPPSVTAAAITTDAKSSQQRWCVTFIQLTIGFIIDIISRLRRCSSSTLKRAFHRFLGLFSSPVSFFVLCFACLPLISLLFLRFFAPHLGSNFA